MSHGKCSVSNFRILSFRERLVENAHFGREKERNSTEFAQKCFEVRSSDLERNWSLESLVFFVKELGCWKLSEREFTCQLRAVPSKFAFQFSIFCVTPSSTGQLKQSLACCAMVLLEDCYRNDIALVNLMFGL